LGNRDSIGLGGKTFDVFDARFESDTTLIAIEQQDALVTANRFAEKQVEQELAQKYGVDEEGQRVSISTPYGQRFPDILTSDGNGIESKVGRTSLTSSIQRQITKDSWLLNGPDSESGL
jgi:hypothetical protein